MTKHRVVNCILLDKHLQVALLHRAPGEEIQRFMSADSVLPESPLQAAVRACKEHTGLVIPKDNWAQFHRERYVTQEDEMEVFYYATKRNESFYENNTWFVDTNIGAFNQEIREKIPSLSSRKVNITSPDPTVQLMIDMAVRYLKMLPSIRYVEG